MKFRTDQLVSGIILILVGLGQVTGRLLGWDGTSLALILICVGIMYILER